MPPKPSCDCGKCPTCYFRDAKRRTRLKQKTPLKRSANPIVRKTVVKKKRAKPRKGPMRNKGYREYLRVQPCVACTVSGFDFSGAYRSFIYREASHTVNNGMKSKGPDSSCIPLCRYHHDEMDGRLSTAITTKKAFAKKYGLDLKREAATHYLAYTTWKESQS